MSNLNVLIPRALAYFFGTSLVDAAWHRGFSAGMRFGWSNRNLGGFTSQFGGYRRMGFTRKGVLAVIVTECAVEMWLVDVVGSTRQYDHV